MSLRVGCVAWLIGIFCADQFGWQFGPLMLAGGGCAGLAWLWQHRPQNTRLLLIGLALCLGAMRFVIAQPSTTATSIWRYNGQSVTLLGTLNHQPDRREDKQTVILTVQTLETNRRVRAVTGLVRVQLPPLPELVYGQRIRVAGALLTPESSPTFDYRSYLARKGIRSIMDQPKLTVLPGVGGSALLRPLLMLNDAARRTTLRLLPEPHASLLLGILLGIQATIPPDVLRDFSVTGTSHLLVISGWNITMVIMGCLALLRAIGVGRRQAASGALGMIAVYVLFVGASPSVLRAAVMGVLVVWAELVGRQSEPWTLLLVACGGLTLLDPNVLWDIGFQLSALATAGLFAFARPLTALLERTPLRWRALRWMIEPLTATLAASTLSLPILLYHFGNLSLIAPLANVAMLPLVPFAMATGSLAVAVGVISLPLGQLLALLSWPFLTWLLRVSHLLAEVPWAARSIPAFHAAWIWGYYALVVLLVLHRQDAKSAAKSAKNVEG